MVLRYMCIQYHQRIEDTSIKVRLINRQSRRATEVRTTRSKIEFNYWEVEELVPQILFYYLILRTAASLRGMLRRDRVDVTVYTVEMPNNFRRINICIIGKYQTQD